MNSWRLTPEDAYLHQCTVGLDAINRWVIWRGHDDLYVSQLHAIGLVPSDVRGIAVTQMPDPGLIVTVDGPSGALVLLFTIEPNADVRVKRVFMSLSGWRPHSMADQVGALVTATDGMLLRNVVGPEGRAQ